MANQSDTYTTEAIACGLSDVAGWLENEGGREKHARTIRLGVERLRELGAASGGEGFVLVPREPTPEMLEAFWLSTGESHEMRARTELTAKRRYAAMIAAAPSHPGEADRVGLRKALTEITDAADKLILSLPGHWHDDATIELTDAAEDARAVLAAAAQNDLYEPVPASLAALGTGEGSGGASASPSGPWDSGAYDFASSVASKVAALTWAWADTADEMDDRYADVQGIVDAELRSLTDDMTAGEIYRTPAPCDGSGEAGETEGLDPKGDSAVTEGQAPAPLPHPQAPNTLSEVEAKAVLNGLDPDCGLLAEHAAFCRQEGSDLTQPAQYRRNCLAHADRIEAALAPLRSEVRDV